MGKVVEMLVLLYCCCIDVTVTKPPLPCFCAGYPLFISHPSIPTHKKTQVRVEDDAADQPSTDGQHLADHLAMVFTLGRKKGKRRQSASTQQSANAKNSQPTLLRRLFGRQRQPDPGLPVSPRATVPPPAQDMSQ